MILTIKTKNVEKTPRIFDRIGKICAKLEQFASVTDPDGLIVKIEVGRITRHHRKGIVYRAEINVALGGVRVHTKAASEDVASALDEARQEIERRLLKTKKRVVSIKHREGVRMKRMTRGM